MSKPKLDNDQRMFALRMHAEGNDSGVIRKELLQRWNISITHCGLMDTCHAKKWQPYIKNFRDTYLAKVQAVPIANKRIRIDDLERERKKLNKLLKECPTKSKGDKQLYISLVAALRQVSEAAREEMEKKPHTFQNIQIGLGVNDEALRDRKRAIISRIRKLGRGRIIRATTDSGGGGEEAQE